MKFLVVYTPQGGILYSVPNTGAYRSTEVEVPEGKILSALDLSSDTPKAVLEDNPVTLTEELKKELEGGKKEREEIKSTQIMMQSALAEFMNDMSKDEEEG